MFSQWTIHCVLTYINCMYRSQLHKRILQTVQIELHILILTWKLTKSVNVVWYLNYATIKVSSVPFKIYFYSNSITLDMNCQILNIDRTQKFRMIITCDRLWPFYFLFSKFSILTAMNLYWTVIKTDVVSNTGNWIKLTEVILPEANMESSECIIKS